MRTIASKRLAREFRAVGWPNAYADECWHARGAEITQVFVRMHRLCLAALLALGCMPPALPRASSAIDERPTIEAVLTFLRRTNQRLLLDNCSITALLGPTFREPLSPGEESMVLRLGSCPSDPRSDWTPRLVVDSIVPGSDSAVVVATAIEGEDVHTERFVVAPDKYGPPIVVRVIHYDWIRNLPAPPPLPSPRD